MIFSKKIAEELARRRGARGRGKEG